MNKDELKLFKTISEIAEKNNSKAYVIGGFVRDLLLNRYSKDIDVTVVGNGIEIAEQVNLKLNKNAKEINVFKNFGTAMFRYKDMEVEFVGARKESYNSDSRKPNVTEGNIEEDIARRDFTINTLAISLNKESYGELVDIYNGINDLNNKLIKTPLAPDITFSDDPLRMLRAIRFATQLDFEIDPDSFNAIKNNVKRIEIISKERITDELNKILLSARPSKGLIYLYETGLLEKILPEVHNLKGVDVINNIGHKDNFYHTIEVVDNVSEVSNSLWLRWAALLHDIGKPITKKYIKKIGWTFHNHDFVGGKMVIEIFRRLKLPLNDKMKYVKKIVELHLRPISLVEESVTDSAIRRLMFDAGEELDDLMIHCKADITSKNPEKVKKYKKKFEEIREEMRQVEERDRIKNWQPPISGEEIMTLFNIKPSYTVGVLKNSLKDAILDGVISNDYDSAKEFIIKKAKELGLKLIIND
ncbi:MAG: tRNA nucleotidyltransferase [Bacteroidetes bacterium GWE2_29_8]|nr:MAG: tRNA nucleotidyltransferase [Bacteroidetes bacterium GWE2_29_8]OFY21716.1 MAG: tRNA nucleotidyltransferase [Bacteroidetes bacterium GWF2_29_10]